MLKATNLTDPRRLVPAQGVLCRGALVELGWPEAAEFDSITMLRNQVAVRRWFLDDRYLEPEANHVWLASGMNRPFEALLAVRWPASGRLVGTVGWSNWDPAEACASFGRIMVDWQALRTFASTEGERRLSPMLDAVLTLRTFAFTEMRLERALSFYIAENSLASKIQRAIGLKEVGRALRTRPDGRTVAVVETELTRQCYESLIG